jgi:hypothetical protein
MNVKSNFSNDNLTNLKLNSLRLSNNSNNSSKSLIETDEEIRRMIDIQYTRDIFLGGSDSLKVMTVSILKDQEK